MLLRFLFVHGRRAQRWYFVPDYETIRMTDDAMAMELVGNTVKLVGADEVVREEVELGHGVR